MSKNCESKKNIKAIILAQGRDFGRCPLASRLPVALWPVADRPAAEGLLRHLSREGIKQAVVCSNGDGPLLQKSITTANSMHVEFLNEPLPAGTGGCIREAAKGDNDLLYLVFHAGIVSPPNIEALIRAHRTGKSDLTVIFEPNTNGGQANSCRSEIYICEPAVLECIPEEGYYDIKEGLIPAMVRAGKTVHSAMLARPVGNFRDRASYLAAITSYLDGNSDIDTENSVHKLNGSKNVWVAEGAKVDTKAQIYGPALIMDGSTVSEKAMIFGPAVIGRNVNIGKNTLIENSVAWDGSRIGQNCEISNCVIGYDAAVPDNSVVADKAVVCKHNVKFRRVVNQVVSLVNSKRLGVDYLPKAQIERIKAMLPEWAKSDKLKPGVLWAVAISILGGMFLWSYWPQLTNLWSVWQRSDEYSSGLLVPFLAFYILWVKRRKLARCHIRPSIWGLFAFIMAQGLRYFGLFFMYSSAERLSLVLSIAALTLLLFGWQVFAKVSSVLVFLCLMLPLPRSVHNGVMLPLQDLATRSAVFCLEMLGYAVVREGNIIHLNGTIIAVAEACNGLRMVMAFFVIISVVVLLIDRAWWEKLIVLVSALPIALVCNTVRLTITSVAFTMLAAERWEPIFHDFGGYAMMPLALVVVIFELWLLVKLTTIPQYPKRQIIVNRSGA